MILVEEVQANIDNGLGVRAAIVEGSVVRLRPILMTALMAGLGLLPAALSHGIGSETQRPFALVIVGGIVSATLFTLLLLPLAVKPVALPVALAAAAVVALTTCFLFISSAAAWLWAVVAFHRRASSEAITAG